MSNLGGMNMEKEIIEMLLKFEKIFNESERAIIINNKEIFIKVYKLGITCGFNNK